MLKKLNRFLIFIVVLSTIACKTSYVKTSISTQNIPTSSQVAPLDSQIVNIYLPYKQKLDNEMNEIIAVSNAYMQKNRPESKLTNLLADLLLEEASRQADKMQLNIQPNISFYNYGGIRSSLPEGDIKRKDVFQLMPFENELVMLELSADTLMLFLNKIARKGGGSIGGATFIIDKDKKAKHIEINHRPLNMKKKYWLTTNDYIANGGDNFNIFKNVRQIKLNKKIRDAIMDYFIRKHSQKEMIQSKLDGRIKHE